VPGAAAQPNLPPFQLTVCMTRLRIRFDPMDVKVTGALQFP